MIQGNQNVDTMTRADAFRAMANEIAENMADKKDYVAGTDHLHMTETASLQIYGNGVHEVNDIAHGQIAAWSKIPKQYYDRMRAESPALLAENVNTWLRQKPVRRMIRTKQHVRAFLSDRYRIIDKEDIAEFVFPIVGGMPDIRISSFAMTDRRLYMKIGFPTIQGEVKKGDIVEAGFVLTNSEVGLGSVSVDPMIMRLQCLNGMKFNASAEYGLKKYHVGRQIGVGADAIEFFKDETLKKDDEAFLLKVRDVINGVASQPVFDKLLGRLRESAEKKLEGNPVKAVEVVQSKIGLRDDETGGVLRHLIEGGDLSQWGLSNAITRTSQDVDDYDRASELEKFGGDIIELKKTDWQEIAQAA
jgi:hypothetical protein